LVGCNQKNFCRGGVVEKLVGGNRIERLSPTLADYQSTRLFDHPTTIDRIVGFGRYEKKGLKVGNQKFQLL